MSTSFVRTTRSLGQELAEKTPLYFLCAALLLGAWGWWLLCARVPVYAGSGRARLEATTTAHRAATSSAGRVTRVAAKLGDLVAAQQILLELDDSVERRRLNEAQANVAALELRFAAVGAERRAEEQVRASQARALEAAVAQSRAALSEATTDLAFRREQAERARELQRQALISASDALVHAEGLSRILSQVSRAEAGLERERVGREHADQVQAAKIAEVERELAELDAERVTALASVATAEAEVAKKVVRAPTGGRVGSWAPLQVGDVLEEGAVVAAVVPDEPLRVVAEFEPSLALGRIRTGQSARVRLAGFSLAEFGRFDARVTQVASEVQGGTIRVELEISPELDDARLQHGLPAQVEVCVDSATPWQLVLRGLGELVEPGSLELAPPPPDHGAGALSAGPRPAPAGGS